MPLSPATLPRHELIGLPVRVAAASDPGLVGVAGEVVAETTRTLSIESDSRDSEGRSPSGNRTKSGDGERVWQVPKAGATFEFTIPDGEARSASERSSSEEQSSSDSQAAEPHDDGESREIVTVEGERLEARPARRTERTGDSKWR